MSIRKNQETEPTLSLLLHSLVVLRLVSIIKYFLESGLQSQSCVRIIEYGKQLSKKGNGLGWKNGHILVAFLICVLVVAFVIAIFSRPLDWFIFCQIFLL